MRKTFKRGRTKAEPMELDITSLLDILVILLVFLLKSYNATNLKLDLVEALSIPDSKARTLGAHAIMLQVDKRSDIWIEQKKVGSAKSGEKIDSLYDFLKQKREIASVDGVSKPKSINLVLHKTLPYATMQRIMHTSALAGFTDFKFIVQGNY
ncbi:MAG: biopolymer transporter ExbD [Bacteriovoracaceae bacterium]